MNGEIVIFGGGAVGCSTAELLAASGRACRVAQRRRPADLAPGVGFVAADVLDRDAVRRAAAGATQIVVAIGFAYDSRVWTESWPRAMANFLAVATETGARIVFVDNLYMYGPQDAPLDEAMPLSDYGVKPAVRSAITRQWQAAAAAGGVSFAALRAPDFYGPHAPNSHLGDPALGSIAKGGAATFVVSPDLPHEMAYVPDFARGVVTLLDAPDDAFGEAWHLPCAPTRTLRELATMAASTIGARPRLRVIPYWCQPLLGRFMPVLRELREMRFQWDRPYRVNADRFARRFAFKATPFEVGIPAAMAYFRAAAAAGASSASAPRK